MARLHRRGRRPRRAASAPGCASASAPTRRRRPTPGRPAVGHGHDRAAGRAGLPAGALDVPAGVQAAIEQRATSAASRPSACGRRSPTTCHPARHCPTRPAAWPSSRRSTRSARSTCRSATCRPRRPPPGTGSTSSSPATPSTRPCSASSRRPTRRRRRRTAIAAVRPAHRRRAGGRARAVPPRPARRRLSPSPGSARAGIDRSGQGTGYGRPMKVDGDIGRAGDRPRRRPSSEAAGYDGVWTAETSHDPFLPLLLAPQHTERPRARHGHRRRLRPQPDDAGPDRVRPADGFSGAASSSASAARSSPTSPGASRWSGRTRRPACGR